MSVRRQQSFAEQTPLTLSVGEVARLLNISRNLAYEAVRTGQIPSIRLSGRILIPRAKLMKMLGEDNGTSGRLPEQPSQA
jgi:excisionase family DNA binding protein